MFQFEERWRILLVKDTIQIFEKCDDVKSVQPHTIQKRIKVVSSISADSNTIFRDILDLSKRRKSWDKTFCKAVILESLDDNNDIIQIHLNTFSPHKTLLARRSWKKFTTGQVFFQIDYFSDKESNKSCHDLLIREIWIITPSKSSELYNNDQGFNFGSTVVHLVDIAHSRGKKSSCEEVKLFYLERIYGLGVFSKDNSVLTATLPQHRKSTLKIEQALRFDPSPQPCTLNDVRKFGSLVKGKISVTENISHIENNCWYSPEPKNYMVRGKSYLKDNKKVPAKSNLGELVAVDWFVHSARIDNVCLQRSSHELNTHAKMNSKFIFAVNIQVPGSKNYSIIFYYLIPLNFDEKSVFGRFILGDDEYRNTHFKLIPNIPKGPWIVQRAVGNKPLIVGGALKVKLNKKKI